MIASLYFGTKHRLSVAMIKFITLAIAALSLVSGDIAIPDPNGRECFLNPHVIKKFKHGLVGINLFGENYDKILLSERDGHALLYDIPTDRIDKRVLLAPAHKEDCTDSESVEFDAMSVSFCPSPKLIPTAAETLFAESHGLPLRKREKTLFNYHVVGSDSPSVAYSDSVNDRFFCEIFPKQEPHLESLAHLPFVGSLSSSLRHSAFAPGDLVFMVDYDKNDVLVQIGTSRGDCDNPLTCRHFHRKITSFASCCVFPVVFVGFEDGEVHAYYFKSHPHSCHGKLICIHKIPAPISCKCVPPIPIGIQLCCRSQPLETEPLTGFASSPLTASSSLSQIVNAHILVSILYRKEGGDSENNDDSKVKTFLKIEQLDFNFDLLGRRGSLIGRRQIGTISNSVIESFIVCCPAFRGPAYVYTLIRDCDGRVFLALYTIRGRFLSKRLLPCEAKIVSWTVAPCFRPNILPVYGFEFDPEIEVPIEDNCCCAYILFELPPPCDDCERCPPKSAVVRFCCDRRRPLVEGNILAD